MKKLALGWLFLLFAVHGACSDDGTSSGEFGATCSTVVDTGSTECDSGVCTDSFDQLGRSVCSIKCTQADPSVCPEGSEGRKCNGKGYCKP